ncbi:unnamed protein product, partial [marine sediment metagenome]
RTLRIVQQAAEADFSRCKQACGFFRRLSAGPLDEKIQKYGII